MPEDIQEYPPMIEPNRKCKATIYVLIKGYPLDEEDRYKVKRKVKNILKDANVRRIKDADAGLLPSLGRPSTILQSRSPRGHPDFPRFEHMNVDYREEENNENDWLSRNDVVNVFLVGIVDFDIDVGREIVDYLYTFLHSDLDLYECRFVALIIKSKLHRQMHNFHTCVPSYVFREYNNEVLIEKNLIKDRERGFSGSELDAGKLIKGSVLRSSSWDTREHEREHSDIFRREELRERRGRTISVPDWIESPEMKSIPNGEKGVGGRNLLLTFGLERVGYRGGPMPREAKEVTPESLGFVVERDENALPNVMLSDKVEMMNAKGNTIEGKYCIELLVKNKTNNQLNFLIPSGLLFETIDPKVGRQNLAVREGYACFLVSGEEKRVVLKAFCVNHRFAPPAGDEMRPTIFRLLNMGSTQQQVWNDLDARV